MLVEKENLIIKNIKSNWLIPLLLLVAGVYLTPLHILKMDLSFMPGDLGDARFNNYILEHGYQYLTGKTDNFWDGNFMFPYKNVIALSDNLIGTLPVYSLFRIFDFDRETSFQLWFISLYVLNFVICYFALYKFTKHKTLSSIGAYIFAFSICSLGQINHVQVFPRFMIPLAFYWHLTFLKSSNLKYLMLSCFGIIFQLYCGIYLGLFTIFLLFLTTLIYFLVNKNAFMSVFRKSNALKFAGIALGSILFAYPLLSHYLFSVNELGYYNFDEVKGYIPSFRSYLFSNVASTTWSSLSKHGQLTLESWWNQMLFPGFIPFIGLLIAPFVIFAKKGVLAERKLLLTLTLTLIIHLFLYTKTGDFTFYKIIYSIPGFGSIRSVDRVINVQIFLILLISILTAHYISIKYPKSNYLIALLPFLVITDNLFRADATFRFLKSDSYSRIANLEKYFKFSHAGSYKAVAYLPLSCDNQKYFLYHLDAMICSQNEGLSCVNAYTGKTPLVYNDFEQNLDITSLKRWLNYSGLQMKNIKIVNELGRDEQNRLGVYIKSNQNKFWSADNDNKLLVDKDHSSTWEEFSIINFTNGTSLLKTYNNMFLYVDVNLGNRISFKSNIDSTCYFNLKTEPTQGEFTLTFQSQYVKLDTEEKQLYAKVLDPDSASRFQMITRN